MIIKLKNPIVLRLLPDTIFVSLGNIFKDSEGRLMQQVNLKIAASSRLEDQEVPEILDEEGNLVGGYSQTVEVVMSAPYYLENPTSLTEVPLEFILGLVDSIGDPQKMEAMSLAIESYGYNNMFQGSLKGMKIDIADIIL